MRKRARVSLGSGGVSGVGALASMILIGIVGGAVLLTSACGSSDPAGTGGSTSTSDGSATGNMSTGPGSVCTTPPPPTCLSPTSVRTYAAEGTCPNEPCTADTCDYAPMDVPCPSGCENDACNAMLRPLALAGGNSHACLVSAAGGVFKLSSSSILYGNRWDLLQLRRAAAPRG